MGLKHGKYVYAERSDGYYVKIRLLGIRFRKKGENEGDINDPSNYVVTTVKTRKPPSRAIVVRAQDLPDEVRKLVESV
ncbi:DUF5622 domain-containing protein [Thermogladius sp. 4427co]|uniref:DUF5622 domain-containing protein n=1 Tax=Thermogladius sp. 4427co TaxID=3450718 RepID=UPI003F793341